jgi:hypothetical protein
MTVDMPADADVDILLSSMEPILSADEFVFCSIEEKRYAELRINPICTFRETEGVTAILRREEAELAGLTFRFPSRMITLSVHSSLDAVGFLARIAAKLADYQVSVNPVSAYHHDHLFVPSSKALLALQILRDLQQTLT